MTLKQKGPVDNTPARPGGSIDKQAAAARLGDEHIEKLRCVVKDAQNFMLSVDGVGDAASGAWRTCWERVDEWAGKAETIVTSYVVGLWRIFANRFEMNTPLDQEWPRFELPLNRLFARMREICDETGEHIADRLPLFRLVSARQPLSAKYRRGPEQVKYEIQQRLSERWRKILRPKVEFSRDFDGWMAYYVKAKVLAESPTTKRGPKADVNRHKDIYKIVETFGRAWRAAENEKKIKELLDHKFLDNPHLAPPKPREKSETPAKSWQEVSHESFINAIRYSVKRAKAE
jgi:hypothetical protein